MTCENSKGSYLGRGGYDRLQRYIGLPGSRALRISKERDEEGNLEKDKLYEAHPKVESSQGWTRDGCMDSIMDRSAAGPEVKLRNRCNS